MLRYARRIARHSAVGRAALDDELTRDAILFELALLDEAANRLSEHFRHEHPEVPWRRIVDQRNILVHVYDALDVERVWQAADAIPALEQQVEALLRQLGGCDRGA